MITCSKKFDLFVDMPLNCPNWSDMVWTQSARSPASSCPTVGPPLWYCEDGVFVNITANAEGESVIVTAFTQNNPAHTQSQYWNGKGYLEYSDKAGCNCFISAIQSASNPARGERHLQVNIVASIGGPPISTPLSYQPVPQTNLPYTFPFILPSTIGLVRYIEVFIQSQQYYTIAAGNQTAVMNWTMNNA